jgi:hypothetical protein
MPLRVQADSTSAPLYQKVNNAEELTYASINIVTCLYFRGLTPAEADLNLLETARRCELYGIKMHPAKVRKPLKAHVSCGQA